MTTTKWQIEFKKWQDFAQKIDARAKALQNSIHDRGWKLAASVGIPHCGCSLHNASIDDDLKGWCDRNPERLRVAKQASHIVNDWTATRIANRITARAFHALCERNNQR